MRRCIKERSALLRGGIVLFFALCAFLLLHTNAFAADYSVTVLEQNAASIRYCVVSTENGKQVLAITATYRTGQMREMFFDAFTTCPQPHTGSAEPSLSYDDFKVILLDAETYCPLCPCGGYRTVRFF